MLVCFQDYALKESIAKQDNTRKWTNCSRIWFKVRVFSFPVFSSSVIEIRTLQPWLKWNIESRMRCSDFSHFCPSDEKETIEPTPGSSRLYRVVSRQWTALSSGSKAVVDSIVWTFRRLKKHSVGRSSPAATHFMPPTFLFFPFSFVDTDMKQSTSLYTVVYEENSIIPYCGLIDRNQKPNIFHDYFRFGL